MPPTTSPRRRPHRSAIVAAVAALSLLTGASAEAQAPAPTVRLSPSVGTACGIELRPSLRATPGGPTCGSAEGDAVDFSAEPAGVSFFGETGADRVGGSAASDVLRGGPGNDALEGGPGDDILDGGDDSDRVNGGEGNDLILERRFGVRENLNGGPNRDSFDCGEGDDTVYRILGKGPDTNATGPGRNSAGRQDSTVRGAGCEHVVNTDPSADFALRDVLGTSSRDILVGRSGPDLLQGKGGADRLFGGSGDDELEGDGASEQGDDLLMGGSGSDRLAGRSGNDALYGDARSPDAGPPGSDELTGGRGRDLMVGGPGPDLIFGAYDGDRIQGGTGNDVVNLLGGDTSNPNGQVTVDCGRGLDTLVVNPARRRGVYRRCEKVIAEYHEVDYSYLARPSPETYPPEFEDAMRNAILVLNGRPLPAAPAPPVEPAP